MYAGFVTRCRFCVDCEDIWDSELCYECFEAYDCYNCDFSRFIRDCSDCAYCYDCLNCHDCFGCAGLRQARYFIFNKQYLPKEYKKQLAGFKKLPSSEIKARFKNQQFQHPHLFSRLYRVENCFGDNISNSKNCFYCFNTKNTHDGAYLFNIYTVYGEKNEDTYDSFFSVDLHNCYECIQVGDGWSSNYCHYCEHIKDSEFCEACFNSQYLFGCIAVNRREYLILNKQYSKDEWRRETAEIKDSFGNAGMHGWDVFDF